MTNCIACPCPDRCPGGVFCSWVGSPDPVLRRHVSARCRPPEPSPVAPEDPAAVAESAELLRRMHACPFRSAGPQCGCAGGACALRHGAVVSHVDCFACLKAYP